MRSTDAPGTSAPAVSVVVAHLNQPEPLRALLASLYAQDFDMGTAEVIVVDNGSRTLPRDVVAGFPGVILAEEAAPGPGHARNRGVALARAPLVAFTDSDCTVAPDWLARIRARFADPTLEILGGEIHMTTEVPGDPNPAEAFDCVWGYEQRDYIERQGFSVTANMAARRALFAVVGPFAGIEVAEDMDWGQRATALGHLTRYAPEVVVFHPARRTMAELYAKWDRNISHHYRVQAQGIAGRLRWVLRALALAVSAPAEIPELVTTDRLPSARARFRAFRGLVALRAYRAWAMLAAMAGEQARAGNLRWNRN